MREYSNNTSFNDKKLEVGDKVFCVIGKHLKDAIIEEILDVRCGPSIRIKGLKKLYYSNSIVKT